MIWCLVLMSLMTFGMRCNFYVRNGIIVMLKDEIMTQLSIDIETYCDRDLKKCGVYKYTESPSFEIILFTYSIDDGPEITIDLTCDIIPPAIVVMILSPGVLKTAYNAAFER